MPHLTNSSCIYKHRKIYKLESLAKALKTSLPDLQNLANRADHLYRIAKQVEKADGSIRITYDALPPLKTIHARIKKRFFDHVIFPEYLTGCIKGRDYKTNASLHTHSSLVITEDIHSFFPSVTEDHIYHVWHGFFGFGPEVSTCLTKITTRCGELPQGAITSPHLANLVFWKKEPILQDKLSNLGITYSRFVDDISLSSHRHLTNQEKTLAIQLVYGMLNKYGFRAKRCKHKIYSSNSRMIVTKLSVNNKPGLEKAERRKIRASVHALEKQFSQRGTISLTHGDFAEVLGKVRHLARFHRGQATPLLKRLQRLTNIVTNKDQINHQPK